MAAIWTNVRVNRRSGSLVHATHQMLAVAKTNGCHNYSLPTKWPYANHKFGLDVDSPNLRAREENIVYVNHRYCCRCMDIIIPFKWSIWANCLTAFKRSEWSPALAISSKRHATECFIAFHHFPIGWIITFTKFCEADEKQSGITILQMTIKLISSGHIPNFVILHVSVEA